MRVIVADTSPVVLEEYETVRVTGLRPSQTDIRAADSAELGKRITLRWRRDDTLEVVAGPYVGVVNLECVSIHVRPKLAGRELAVLQMLDYASGLSALRDLEQVQHFGEGLNLRDLVCLLLTREADRLLRHGLRRDYLRREEALPTLRGRLLPDRQILRRYGQLDRLECRYDELSSDIVDNRLCGAALQVAARTATDSTVRKHARRLAGDFTNVCATDAFYATKAEQRLSYHRGNEHYRSAHRWALLLLHGTAFADLYAVSGPSSQAFMFDMNRLFEKFVTRLLQDAAHGTGIKVRAQASLSRAICHEDGRSHTTITPDIQLIRGHGLQARRCSIDAKYKNYTHNKITPIDLYQSFAYAEALSHRAGERTPTAFILYASDCDSPPRSVILHRHDRTQAARITSIAVNLPATLKALKHNDREAIDRPWAQIMISFG